MDSIRWLHLSDLHIGHPENPWVNNALQLELERLIQNEGRLDFILITGDIIHRGKYSDSNLSQQAKQLIQIFKNKCKHIIFSIGNHDYERDCVRMKMLADWQKLSLEEKIEQSEIYERRLSVDFEKYVKFCNKITGNSTFITTKSYVYTQIHGINIVVLNTSVFAGQPMLNKDGEIMEKDGKPIVDDSGKLWFSESSLCDVKELNKGQPTIVVGHHTLDMFEEYSRKKLAEVFTTMQAKYYFCGHIHETEERCIDGITQIASAGVFKDSYNRPKVKFHQMRMNANEHIDSKTYAFKDGCWQQEEEKADDTVRAGGVSKVEQPERELKNTDLSVLSDFFTINRSIISDGAIRFPYNGGTFNLYTSKSSATDTFSPHLHKDIDEVTYVTNGALYAYIDDECTYLTADSSTLIPKGKLHAFLPVEYPCAYITMGIESGDLAQYETTWNRDITKLQELDTALSQNISEEKRNRIFEEMIAYLKCSVLEVRWAATEILKKYLAQDSDDSTYIESCIQQMVINAVREKCIEQKLFGLSMAYEFRTKISVNAIRELMINAGSYILAWNCAYYLMEMRPNIDYEKLFNKTASSKPNINIYYERIIIALLQLMIKRNGSCFEAVYKEETQHTPEKSIPVDDVIIHFVLWYTSFPIRGELINYNKAKASLNIILGNESGEILRGLLNYTDHQERFRVLQVCKSKKILADVVKAFFESFECAPKESHEEKTMKDNIKEYLRVIVSEKCNIKCAYCHHEGKIDSLVGSSIKYNPNFNLKELLAKAKQCGFRKIKVSGGEPLLYPNVLEICNEFQDDFDDIGFTTNGTNILALKKSFEKIKGSKLSFNVTLNSLYPEKYNHITQVDKLETVKEGIAYLVQNGFKVKINSVITSYNFDDMEMLVGFAARMRVDIKLLDLFSFGNLPEEFQHVSIAEIKSRLMELYNVSDTDFYALNDYMCMDTMGIRVLIPKRLYSSDCQYNCNMYPCAEGLFGIRVYEDYSCAYCFKGKIYSGGIECFEENVNQIRAHLDLMKFTY